MPSVSRYAWAVARRKCVWRIQASIPRRHVASISCAAIAAKWVAAITCTYNCCSVFCFVFFLLEINGIWKAYFNFQDHTEQKKKRKVLFFKLHATQNEQNNLFIQRCKERGWISAAGMSSLAGKQIINWGGKNMLLSQQISNIFHSAGVSSRLRIKLVSIKCAKLYNFQIFCARLQRSRPTTLTIQLDKPERLALCLQPLFSFGFLLKLILCQTFCMFEVWPKQGGLRKWRKHLAGGCCHWPGAGITGFCHLLFPGNSLVRKRHFAKH